MTILYFFGLLLVLRAVALLAAGSLRQMPGLLRALTLLLLLPAMPFFAAQKWKVARPAGYWFINVGYTLLYLFFAWQVALYYHWL